MKIEYRPIDSLIMYARNPRKNDAQIDRMVSSINEFGFRLPILIKSDGNVIDGHLRIKAAKKLGMTELPCVLGDGMSDAQVRAFRLLANRSVQWAEWDEELLKLEFEDLQAADFALDMTGFDLDEIAGYLTGMDGKPPPEGAGVDNTYSNKIVAPIYEPKGDCPPISMLIDRSKTDSLVDEINASGIPSDIAEFLRYSAERHTVFHFGRIAEYYCHAKPEVQELMEKSGMVIIDFKKAIEYGFVHLTERLGELADLEEADNA